jgi:hypothetical protein
MPVILGRRELIAAFGGAAAAWPLAARGQQPGQVRRIGILMPYPKSDAGFLSHWLGQPWRFASGTFRHPGHRSAWPSRPRWPRRHYRL